MNWKLVITTCSGRKIDMELNDDIYTQELALEQLRALRDSFAESRYLILYNRKDEDDIVIFTSNVETIEAIPV